MADLTIRGAGIFGLSIAWEAIRRGARVRVIDPGGPGAGASGGILGALQPHTPDQWNAKKAFQFESLCLARDFWSGVEAVSGIPSGYAASGRLQPLADDRAVALARDRAVAAAANWRGRADWEVIGAEAAGDWRPQSPSGLFVRDSLSAHLHPRRAIQSLSSAVRMRGGTILAEGPDTAPVVWATGWQGLAALGQALGRPAGDAVAGQAALLRHNAAGRPQIFVDGLHIVPHLDGTVAVGSTSGPGEDGRAALDALVERAVAAMPVLHGAPMAGRWSGLRPRAPSRAPLLGPWPGRAGHFVANGGFKIGFGMAPLAARVMADLVLEGRDGIPDEFHTDRL